MKLSVIFSAALVYGSVCAALEEAQEYIPNPVQPWSTMSSANSDSSLDQRDFEIAQRDGSICSIGIGRVSGTINWDATIYNVPQAERQIVNIVGTATFVPVCKFS
jgi:hypothetical protein